MSDKINDMMVPSAEANRKTYVGSLLNAPPFADTLATLENAVKAENPHDFRVELPEVKMQTAGGIIEDNRVFKYTAFALKSLAKYFRPEGAQGFGTYLTICPPKLRAVNYNYWHTYNCVEHPKAMAKDVVFRTRVDENGARIIRGVVSTVYTPIDDVYALTTLGTLLPTGALMQAVRGDTHSRFNILWPNPTKINADVGSIHASVHVTNSEVGAGSFRAAPMLYLPKQDVSFINEAVSEDVSVRHVGEALDRLHLALNTVFDYEGPFISALELAVVDRLVTYGKTPEEVFKIIGEMFKLGEQRIDRIMGSYTPTNNQSLFDIAVHVARSANDENVEDGVELQAVAGKLISKGFGYLGFKRVVELE